MDDPKITMEEYIQLIPDKARGRDQTFNCENATYSEEYCDDLDSFIDFETDFPAIVYNDASTSYQNVSSEPTTVYTAYSNPMDTAYLLSGRYPVFILSTVYTMYSLNEYSVYRNLLTRRQRWWSIYKSENLEVLES
uniref:Uncharacterized protein n=1 Tax=Tanacetum cinerariifolium TaxID=118510 RepID=A0A699JKN5_TANCI|nr:hypothetical protein [Tanacetum cinerariifolium]